MGTDKNKKRYVITDSVQRRLQKISQDKYAEPPRIELPIKALTIPDH